ncbi:MAG: UDP-N-acetylmuramoyl-tripeptide--D-alanyl-D-alanine ligase [Candidatus Omnitrophica bacterium]|nr:UDP-N-acetylmuramoyl-tripeptide--D-alanyl-D-alanine ligase [Candidatus Omnitrophota bacterium]
MFTLDDILTATGGRLVAAGGGSGRITGISTDTRTIRPSQAFLALKGRNYDGHAFIGDALEGGARCVIGSDASLLSSCSSKYARACMIAVEDTTRALGDIARRHRDRFDLPVIAVTGSNGKTTTKDMIACCLSGKCRVLKTEGTRNNHIGVPLTLLKLKASCGCAVLELGTNHPGEISYLAHIARPTLGVITNIGPSHLEHLGSLAGVLREKYSMSKYLNGPAVMVLNADDPMLEREIRKPRAGLVTLSYGITNRADFSGRICSVKRKAVRLRINDRRAVTLPAWGMHNVYNALAALAVAAIMGIPYRDSAARLQEFRLPSRRLNVSCIRDVLIIDDTYNSNPLSLIRALETLRDIRVKGRKIFVMGDMLELGEQEELFHREAGEALSRVCDALITVGKLSRFAADAAQMFGFNTEQIFTCASAPEARDILLRKLRPVSGDVVLVKGSRSMAMEKVLGR